MVVDGTRSLNVTSLRPIDEREIECDLMGGVEIEPARLGDGYWDLSCHDGPRPERILTEHLADLLGAAQQEQLRAVDEAAAERFERVKIADAIRLIRPLSFDGFELLELTATRQELVVEARDPGGG